MTAQELINQTKQLVRIASTGDSPAELQRAVDFVAEVIRQRCPAVTIERFEHDGKPSFLAYRGSVRPEKFAILLNGHVDVVPASKAQFKPVEKDGKLYGRGALDMKGTTLALADVFCEVVEEVPYSLGLQVVSDEEVGGYSGVKYQIDQGVRAEFVIMGEYANDRNTIYNAARGLCWAEIAFKGKTAHGGHLWKGQNAVVKAGAFAGAVLQRYPTPDKETWTTTASIANLSTPNTTYNKVPDSAVLKIDFRFTQEDSVFASEDAVRAFIASIDPDAELVNIATFEPAVNVEELNPYVQGLSAAMCRTTGAKPHYLGRPGGSDGRHFAMVGIDIIEFGLYGKDSHSDDEYVELASFGEYQAIMRDFLRHPIPAKLKKSRALAEPLHHRLLRELVAFPTLSGDFSANNKALKYIGTFLAERGLHIRQFESEGYRSIIATIKPNDTRPTIMLSAHIDVVPAGREQFALSAKGDELHGRGALDMKSAIASYMWLVDQLQHELDKYNFGIMITSDEEIGGQHGARLLLEQEGYLPKVVIIPDGGENWQFERFAKSVQWIKLESAGKSAHASRPWEGDSAIQRLLGALREVEVLAPANPSPEDTLLSVGTIEGGITANQISASASAMLDVRCGNILDYEQMYPRIQEICARHGVKSRLLVSDPPCVNDMNDPYIQTFRSLVTAATGRPADSCFGYGATDGRFFSKAGVPCIITSPPGKGRHQDSEWISSQGFDHFCAILKQYVQKIGATAAPVPKARRLPAATSKYVWYAPYGTGLCKEYFTSFIRGGRLGDTGRIYTGCTDKSVPLRDAFMALPHELYFGGESKTWGGGLILIDPKADRKEHTIARRYLITLEQFSEIVAQENFRDASAVLPLAQAIKHGHATIGNGDGNYEELVYCGTKEGYPVFTITSTPPRQPYNPPSSIYTRLLCLAMSRDNQIDAKEAVEYLLNTPGVKGTYEAAELSAWLAQVKIP